MTAICSGEMYPEWSPKMGNAGANISLLTCFAFRKGQGLKRLALNIISANFWLVHFPQSLSQLRILTPPQFAGQLTSSPKHVRRCQYQCNRIRRTENAASHPGNEVVARGRPAAAARSCAADANAVQLLQRGPRRVVGPLRGPPIHATLPLPIPPDLPLPLESTRTRAVNISPTPVP